MNFLEARRILSGFAGGPELPFLFALSGTSEPFELYLEAAGAIRGRSARPRFLPFNTLQQHLAIGGTEEPAVYLLLPWDLLPETDWRSGIPVHRVDLDEAIQRAEQVAERLRGSPNARMLYLPAAIPPVAGRVESDRTIALALQAIAARLSADILSAEAFSLSALFASGCPVGGHWLGRVADRAVQAISASQLPAAKVLVTDLDNTIWSGVIAEDGADGIHFGPEGAGYRHYVYQTLLARLRREGTILAAVSRNDAEAVMPPLRSGRMPLTELDFVAICASYHAKSAQIRQLAKQLNLGLEAFVFVDDNPVEREEVQQALPEVLVLPFPNRDEGLPGLLEHLSALFGRRDLTPEDRERTQLYRRRLEGMVPADASGADLTSFLAGLAMKLTVYDRSTGDRSRAVQLINKTNQFNANGRRWTTAEIGEVLAQGGKLLGASLDDRSGSHGEVLSFLVGSDGTIQAFVMSCRVFQRRVEFAFLAALVGRGVRPTGVRTAATERNEPFRQFLLDPAFAADEGGVRSFDPAAFGRAHQDELALFDITWE